MRSAAKLLKFPLAGIARDVDYRKAYIPSEERMFASPFAVNVRGSDTFHRRNRGGSRPGLSSTALTDADVRDQHPQFQTDGLDDVVPVATAKYRGRIVAAEGTAWYMSAILDDTDWDFGGNETDPSRAAAGNIALADCKGEEITALIPLRDDYLYITTAHSTWVLAGDPLGGSLKCVSEHVGCVSRDAWAFDGNRIWLVSDNGLYVAGSGEPPIKASSRIPEEFSGMTSAVLAYDPDDAALHVFGIRRDGTESDWFYDYANKAFWRMEFKALHRPTNVGYAMIDGVESVVFKGLDGVWRVFDDEADDDDGEAFVSIVAIGPIRTSYRDDKDGLVDTVEGTLAEGSDDASLQVYCAHSPEKAVELAYDGESPFEEFALHAGWNNVFRPRRRGVWAVFVISSSGRWGYESVTSTVKLLGTLR